jgi:STE24 endopeptidase
VLLLGLLPFFWSISGNISEKIYGKSEVGSSFYYEILFLQIFQSIVFASLTSIIETLIGIPFELFDTFVIEEKHGFNKQVGIFDLAKSKNLIF